MAGRPCGSMLYHFDECHIPCLLSDGRSDRAALSRLRHDPFPVSASDRQSETVHMDAPDGRSDRVPVFLLPVEQIHLRETRQRNEISDYRGNSFADCPVLCADVPIFPGQSALRLYER